MPVSCVALSDANMHAHQLQKLMDGIGFWMTGVEWDDCGEEWVTGETYDDCGCSE